MTAQERPEWMPLDPDASPYEQQLLDEANGLLLTLRALDAGQALTGRAAPEARARIMRRLDDIREALE